MLASTSRLEGAMQFVFRAGAGALGGVAAGLLLLGASSAPAAEPAVHRHLISHNSNNPSAGLVVVSGEGTLKRIESASALDPVEWAAGFQRLEPAPTVRLPDVGAYAGVTPGDPLTCLTQAIYFEARSQSEAGQEAVAQVVMNRTHLPQYPDSVCGVVYQGAERTTGCQFTFVCDGSLKAPTDADAWARAGEIARKALAGFVYAPMAAATHYHAAWMTPYWAGSLTRIRQLGGQVFYH
ncbi:MAG TPA: cell wall hydrolase [Caulobacteraceae bacterium]